MIWSVKAQQDATIYEKDPYRNTGLDSLLELSKKVDSATSDIYESRALIKFNLDELSAVLAENGVSINAVTASLKLYTVVESDLPRNYTIEAKAISKPWENGSGYLNFPAAAPTSTTIVDGVNWINVAGSGSAYWSSSLAGFETASFITEGGGGSWYTSSIHSQSFSFNSSDTVDIDVTSTLVSWYNGSMNNNGFLVSLKQGDLASGSFPESLIQLYSTETHTVFHPQLYVSWQGTQYYSSSLSLLTYDDNPMVYVRSFRAQFPQNKKVRVLLGSRSKFPRASFSQNTNFSTMKKLPSGSYYQIRDAHSDLIIIPYSENTKINTNNSGSYFDFYTTMMYPERYYKFEIKVIFDGIAEYFQSNDFIFKIVK